MLPPLTVGFLTGLLVGSYAKFFPLTLFFLLLLCALTLVFLERTRPVLNLNSNVLYASLLAGALYWSLFNWATGETQIAYTPEAPPTSLVGTIVQPVRSSPDRLVTIVSDTHIVSDADNRPGPERVRVLWRSPDRTFQRGDQVAFRAKLRPPSGTLNPWGFDYAAYLDRQGIDAVASVTGPNAVRLVRSGSRSVQWAPWHLLDEWRDRIRAAATTSLTQPAVSLYLGMIIGEGGYLAPEVRDQFMATGTVHILSISGSHLGLIALLSFFLVRKVCLLLPAHVLLSLSRRMIPSRLAAIVTVLPVTFYALLAGAEVATVRSLLMILLFLLAVWLGYERPMLNALSVAAFVIVLHDPRALFDISFQLSFLSVLSLALFLQWTGSGEREEVSSARRPAVALLRWGADSLLMTGIVTVATLPLVAFYFNQVAWMGLFANLIIVPLAGFVLVPLGLASSVWLLFTGDGALPAVWLNQTALDVFMTIVRGLARAPGTEWHVASPAIPLMVVFYGLLALSARPQTRILFRAAAGVGVLGLLGWWGWSPRGHLEPDSVRVTFLDVGQGDATVIELSDGQTVLIDGGATYERFDMGRGVVAPFLWNRGIRRLDHVIGTHPQLDHVGGLTWIVRHFDVGQYWGNGIGREEAFFLHLQQALREQGLREQVAQEGTQIIESPCGLASLNPPPQGDALLARRPSSSGGSTLNNESVVTRLDCGPHSFLFTADVEREALVRLSSGGDSERITVLKVPHHGARSSLFVPWLEQLHPQVAVISVGRHNSYGHPSPLVLEAYQDSHVPIRRTDREGAVWIVASPMSPRVTIHTAREWVLVPVSLATGLWANESDNHSRLWYEWFAR